MYLRQMKRRIKKMLLLGLLPVAILYLGMAYYLSGLVIQGPPRRDIPTAFAKMQQDWQINRDSMLQQLPVPEEVSFRTGDFYKALAQPHTGTNIYTDSLSAVASLAGARLATFKQAAITLRGWWFTANDTLTAPCVLVMAHGFTDNRSGMLKYAGAFAGCGCDLLLYDHRAHYESGLEDDEGIVTGGILEAADLLAAHRFATQKSGLPDQQIGWVGESWGAAAAIIAAGYGDIQAAFVVADSPYADWYTAVGERAIKLYGGWIKAFLPLSFRFVSWRLGLDYQDASPERWAARVKVPILLVHSAADVETAPQQSLRIYDQLPEPDMAEIHLLDWNSWHAQSAARRPQEYRQLVMDFVADKVPGFCRE